MACSKALEDSVEGLYAAFSGYPLPKFTDPCTHCHSIDDELKVHAQPLRELDLDHLRDYAADALLVWGDESVFKHFLPRIFELFVRLPDPTVQLIDAEIMFSKFRYGNWRTWPNEEQAAVDNFLHAVWREVLSDPPVDGSYLDVESWVCAIAQCEDDLGPYLDEWVEDERRSASLALSSFLLTSAVARAGSTGRNAFWKERDSQYGQIQQWVKSPSVIEKLCRAEAECNDAELAHEFAAARAMCAD